VAQAEQQQEVGEQVAVEDGFQVELDVGGADQRRRIPKQPQCQAIAQDCPLVGVRAIEQFLHHRLRR